MSAWSNWAGTVTADPTVVRPRTPDHVAEVVRDAAARGRRVRPVGCPAETPPDRDPVARSPCPRPLPFRRTVG